MSGTILNLRSTGGAARSIWTRHSVGGSLTRCGLWLSELHAVQDLPAVQGEIRNCKRCERLEGNSLGTER